MTIKAASGAADKPPTGGTLACRRLDGFVRLIAGGERCWLSERRLSAQKPLDLTHLLFVEWSKAYRLGILFYVLDRAKAWHRYGARAVSPDPAQGGLDVAAPIASEHLAHRLDLVQILQKLFDLKKLAPPPVSIFARHGATDFRPRWSTRKSDARETPDEKMIGGTHTEWPLSVAMFLPGNYADLARDFF